MSKVERLADELGRLDPRAAGMLGDALMRALGIRVRYVVVQPAVPLAPPPPAEPDEVSVILAGYDEARKMALIREVRALTGLGLAESKRAVEGSHSVPWTFREGVAPGAAADLRDRLVQAGAVVRLG